MTISGIKVEHINPFLESVQDVFDSMLSCQAKMGTLKIVDSPAQPKDITALIGLSGLVRGNVALAFPVLTAIKIASHLTGTEITLVDETVCDAVGELVSIVAGNAKAKLSKNDEVINLTLPSVVRGGFKLYTHSDNYWISMPFESPMGIFTLSLTFEDQDNK